VLLLEADLRRPTAARSLSLAEGPGVAEVLADGMSIEEATQHLEVTVAHRSISVDVLVAGRILPPNPAHVTESRSMKTLLERVRSAYDLVVVDTPPLSLVSDAFPLLHIADGVLIVSRLERNNRDVAERLRATLATSKAPAIGVVANGYRQRGASPYGYGYEYPASPPEVRSVADTNGSEPNHAVEPEFDRRE
jgi:Mrp family chromosome partitioning ATPase